MFGMDKGYWLYMNEAEGTGLVKTREGKVNSVGRKLADMGYRGKVVPTPVFLAVCREFELYNVTEKEVRTIEERWL